MINQAVLKPYGTLTGLKLDSTARTIDAHLDLKGETNPVQIQIRGYEVHERGGQTFLTIKDMSTSREWLTTLARDFAVDRPFEVPESVKKFLPMLLGS